MPRKPKLPRSKRARPAPATPAEQTMGMRLRIGRNAARLYLSDVADKLGLSKQAVGHWESDRTEPTIASLRALAQLYGVTVGWLINGGPGLLPPELQGGAATHPALQQLTMMIQAFQSAGIHNIRAWIDADGTPQVEATKDENSLSRR
jgi:transcriptional regulator with XRE-family HTH domain